MPGTSCDRCNPSMRDGVECSEFTPLGRTKLRGNEADGTPTEAVCRRYVIVK